MNKLPQDLLYLENGLQDLPAYLEADLLFWPLTPPTLPRLTISGLLLSLRRAAALAATPGQRQEVAQRTETLNRLRAQYRVHWENKAARELDARLRQWRNFLQDYRENPPEFAPSYPHEVHARVMLSLLLPELPPTIKAESAIQGLDALLQAVFQPGPFIWEAILSTAFPQADFWYLYGHLRH